MPYVVNVHLFIISIHPNEQLTSYKCIRKLKVAQRAMEMLGISLRDRISNEDSRKGTRVTDTA